MRARLIISLIASGCYSPVVHEGVPCMQAADNCPDGEHCIARGGVYGCWSGAADDAGVDTPDAQSTIDAVKAAVCAHDPTLGLCFDFDASVLANPLPNEGAFVISAQLTNVARIAEGSGGAALLGPTSEIYLPVNTVMTNILTVEARIRIDVDPALGARVGIGDADPTTSSVSMFYYHRSDPMHEIRCEFGVANDMYAYYTAPIGTYVHVACVCDAGTTIAYVNGLVIGTQAGCTAGLATTYGYNIGANNQTQAGGAATDRLTGAVDMVRLWTRALSAAEVCAAAGGQGC